MPELPEVETTVRALRGPLIGRTFTGVDVQWPRHVAKPAADELAGRLVGCRVAAVHRRGKYLLFTLHPPGQDDPRWLIVHLKMSGHLSVAPASRPRHRHDRTIFRLDNGRELRFRDQRKFGKVYLVADPEEVVGRLGPEPLEPAFTPAALRQRLSGRRRALKPLLLDQQFVAGIGNIYADEALFHARLRPERPSDTLSAAEIDALHAAIQHVLQLGIRREGASIDLYVKPDGTRGDMQNAVAVFRRQGEPCYDCGTPIERIVLGGRSTHFCPRCQK